MRSNVVSSLACEIWQLLKSSRCLLCHKRGPVDQALQQPTAMDALVPIEAGAAPAPDSDPDQGSAPAPAQTPDPDPDPAPSPAAAPYELLQLVTLFLDSEAKRTWRLVSKATCHAVYESTRGLDMGPSRGIDRGASGITALPLPLLGKCGGLRRLLCKEAPELKSIHGLPRGLEVLEINGEAITDLSPLQRCSGLRQLSVCYSGVHLHWGGIITMAPAALFTAGGWTELRAALQCMPRLQLLELQISPRKWGVKAMQILAPALQTLTEMQTLRISGGTEPALGEEAARALASALVPLTKLQHLHLSSLYLHATGASVLAPSLGCLTGLQTLNLCFNFLGPGGVLALTPALAALTALQHLDLSINMLGPDGSKSLAPALQALSSLQVLDLSRNHMGGEAAQVLAPILRTITSLRRLEFEYNHMADGRKALAPLMDVVGLVVHIGMQFEDDGYDDIRYG